MLQKVPVGQKILQLYIQLQCVIGGLTALCKYRWSESKSRIGSHSACLTNFLAINSCEMKGRSVIQRLKVLTPPLRRQNPEGNAT